MKETVYACMSCGYVGPASHRMRLSIPIAIVLFIAGFIPGVLYVLGCMVIKKHMPICQSCGKAALIPAGSPQGIKIAEQFTKLTQNTPQ